MMNVGIPEFIWILLSGMSLAMSLFFHGEPKGNYSFWSTLIALALEFWIVWAGGFFR